jgi:hypothetical protein
MIPFAYMRLDQDPDTRGDCPAFEVRIGDFVNDSNDNILVLECLKALGKSLSL